MLLKIFETIKQFLFTPCCFVCGKTLPFNSKLPFVCEFCKPNLDFLEVEFCSSCNKPRDIEPKIPFCPYCNGKRYPFKNFISPFYYHGAIKISIQDYKFSKRRSNAKTYAYFLSIRLKYLSDFNPQVIVPVPSSKKRLRERGFNHTKLLCKYLSKYLNIPTDNILVKIRHTPPQSTLNMEERLTNLKDAFICTKHNYTNVLLLDDVYTTGSTIKELCKILKQSGIKTIHVVTVAKNNL